MKKINISSETMGYIGVIGGMILMCIGMAFVPQPEATLEQSNDDLDLDDLIKDMKPSAGGYSWEGCCMNDSGRMAAIDSLANQIEDFDFDSNKLENVKGIFVIAQDGNRNTRVHAIKTIDKIAKGLSFTSNKKTCRDYIVKLAAD